MIHCHEKSKEILTVLHCEEARRFFHYSPNAKDKIRKSSIGKFCVPSL